MVPAEPLEIAVPVEANRAIRLDPGPDCVPSALVATVQIPVRTGSETVDLGACARPVLDTGPLGGELIVTLRALAGDVPVTVAVVYADATLENGSFELPAIETPYLTVPAGGTIGPWTVTAGEVDIQFTWATAQHGRQSIDLSGFVGGRICQRFATMSGAAYQVSFWMSHNAVALASAALAAGITGLPSHTFVHGAESDNVDPQWERHSFDFAAAGPSSELCFESADPPVGSPPDGAAMLDAVTVDRREP